MTEDVHLAELFKGFNVPAVSEGQCPVCGASDALLPFQDATLPLEAPGGHAIRVEGLDGERCSQCGEVFLSEESGRRFTEAGDALVIEARRLEAAKLKAARLRLGLTQRAASLLTGGGHNAFSRYESGQAVPVPAVGHLMNLLARHPELGSEIPGVSVVPAPRNSRKADVGEYVLKVSAPRAPGKMSVSLNVPGMRHLADGRRASPQQRVAKRAASPSVKKGPR